MTWGGAASKLWMGEFRFVRKRKDPTGFRMSWKRTSEGVRPCFSREPRVAVRAEAPAVEKALPVPGPFPFAIIRISSVIIIVVGVAGPG